MKIPAKIVYVYKASFELALAYKAGKPIQINNICKDHTIPNKFLLQLMIQLKNRGLVQSVRGSNGGYLLAKSPAEITLYDLIQAIDSQLFSVCLENEQDRENCLRPLIDVWENINKSIIDNLSGMTLEDIAVKGLSDQNFMYSI